jgi:hypothetical protein
MSGLEVIGVVLGALPLLIMAVQEYEKALGPLGMLVWPSKYRQELQRLNRQLRTQRDLFESSLKVLLTPAIDEATFAHLLNAPNCRINKMKAGLIEDRRLLPQRELFESSLKVLLTPAIDEARFSDLPVGAKETGWLTHEMKEKLERLVPMGCLFVIEDMADIVRKLQDVLRKPKVEFSFTRPRREKLMNDLRRCNSDLQGFASQKIGIGRASPTEAQSAQESRLSLDRFSRIRSITWDLYSALQQSIWFQQSSCHVVGLYIEIEDSSAGSRYRLLLAHMRSSQLSGKPPQWLTREVTVKLADKNLSHEAKTEGHCNTIDQLMEAKADSQLYVLGSTHLFQLQATAEPKTSDLRGQNIYHLSHVLERSEVLASELAHGWHRWQRAQVAVILAHAMLHLHKSPWLEATWNSGDIQLMGNVSKKVYEPIWYPLISRPFLLHSASQEPLQPLAAGTSKESVIAAESMSLVPISKQRKTENQSGPRVRNRDLYNLGIILVELAFNTTLRQKRQKQDEDNTPESDADAWIDHNTACRLLENELVWEMGPDYANIVRRCIYGFDIDTHDLENPRFHNVVCKGVLEPLKKDMILRSPNGR